MISSPPSTAIGQLAPVANGLALMSFVDFVSREDVLGFASLKLNNVKSLQGFSVRFSNSSSCFF